MTEYIDKTEAMRRFMDFGREIPKEQVMAVLARIDEGIVRCKECKYFENHNCVKRSQNFWRFEDFCSYGERGEE